MLPLGAKRLFELRYVEALRDLRLSFGQLEAAVELTEEQIDQIARRVAELVGGDVVREVAWEVVPDMAEVVVRERLRMLELEAEEA